MCTFIHRCRCRYMIPRLQKQMETNIEHKVEAGVPGYFGSYGSQVYQGNGGL